MDGVVVSTGVNDRPRDKIRASQPGTKGLKCCDRTELERGDTKDLGL